MVCSERKYLVLLLIITLITFCSTISASPIISATMAVASTEYGDSTGATAIRVIDGSRLNSSNQLVPGAWYNNWLFNATTGANNFTSFQWIYIDLGQNYNIDEIRIWNYFDNNVTDCSGRGLKDFDLYIASDGATVPVGGTTPPGGAVQSPFTGPNGWSYKLGSFDIPAKVLNKAPQATTVPIGPTDTFVVTGTNNVRYIGIDIGTALWNGSQGGSIGGLAQIQVTGVPSQTKAYNPVPLNGANNVERAGQLSWSGPTMFTPTGYTVYLDTDQSKVVAGTGCAYTSINQPGTTFAPEPYLQSNTVYYWRVKSLGDPQNLAGDIWTFQTTPPPDISQKTIDRVQLMPNIPSPFQMKDWKATTLGYDSFVFNFNTVGTYLPLIWWDTSYWNFVRPTFGLPSHVGSNISGPTISDGSVHVSLSSMPPVLGATLVGIDKSNQNGYNWALMCENYFNIATGENMFLSFTHQHTGTDWFYDILPSILMTQINYYYPTLGNVENELKTTANKFYDSSVALGGASPNFLHSGFDFLNMLALDNGSYQEPDSAGGYAWMEYMSWVRWNDQKYLNAADWSLQYLNTRTYNPLYDCMLPYGAYTAARMNAELDRGYDLQKILNWCFGTPVATYGPSKWGVEAGHSWGGYGVDGLVGSDTTGGYGGYVFQMETFIWAENLIPVVRYDSRFARAIGKWMLNAANNTRLFYPDALPAANQSSSFWTGDPNHVIAYEALRSQGYGSVFASDYSLDTGTLVLGSAASTTKQDSSYQAFEEATAGTYDQLTKKWVFTLPSGAIPDYLVVIGHVTDGGDADNGFKFTYSSSANGTYYNMFTISSSSDTSNSFGSFGSLSTIYVRAQSTNTTSGNTAHDKLYIDQMYLMYKKPSVSPYAMGDTIMYGVGDTDLGLYGSGWVGIFGGTISTTNESHIIQIDCLKTDVYHAPAYPTYLYYNPETTARNVSIDVGFVPKDLYDSVSKTFLVQNVSGITSFPIPADSAVVVVLAPAGGARTYINEKKLLIDGVVVDYNYRLEDWDNSFMDWQDLAVMANSWLQTGDNMPQDWNRDGIVNFKDFSIMANRWR